jgi:hypothetical protein
MKIKIGKMRAYERAKISRMRKEYEKAGIPFPIPKKPFPQYVRCPVCGKLSRAQQIGLAGRHRLETKKIIASLGWRKGFVWTAEPYSVELAMRMIEILKMVINQIKKEILGIKEEVIKEEEKWEREKELLKQVISLKTGPQVGLRTEQDLKWKVPATLSFAKTQRQVKLSSVRRVNVRGVTWKRL